MLSRFDCSKVVVTAAVTSQLGRVGYELNHDWTDSDEQVAVLRALLGPKADVAHRPRNDCAHARRLHLQWSDGASVEVHLDQGLGFFEVMRDGYQNHTRKFDFRLAPEEQARALLARGFRVRKRTVGPVPLYARLHR